MSFISFPILMILMAMISIQWGASFAKELFLVVGPAAMSGLRLIFAAAILLVIWRPWRTPLQKSSYRKIVLYGASLGAMNLLFYLSLDRIPLGIAVALEFTGPLSISLLQSRKPLDFLWAILATAGIYLILPVTDQVTPLDIIGILLALGAGACWALYIYFGRTAGQSENLGAVTSLGMMVAALVVLPFAFFYSDTSTVSLKIIPMAFLIAVLSSALPYSLEMVALRKIPTKTFGILMSLEPATAALMGYLNLKEVLNITQIIAITCVIMASAGAAWSDD
ncbi:MAG: transporter [Bdellovibrionales bacterium RIFCSPHIGHO2_01_FULL_40_29]|nr:MAG: transporter [Bdellovibrionales bacterium RIFCSPHIGHO2_01_FULL_40_29]OFZ33787.1 MAG: transporter [Bdellovibrionales bacterium RIFCSPHIGHO2_02_FULL_40_15]